MQINVYGWESDTNANEQLDKIADELDELRIAISNNDKDNIAEEIFDIIESAFNMFKIVGDIDIIKENRKHLHKLLSRDIKRNEYNV